MKWSCFLFLAGCSASVPFIDASTDSSLPDAGGDAARYDAGSCGPADAGYIPGEMHPPNPPHANKCSAQQAQDYAACQGGDPSKCTEFGMGGAAYACGQCIESQQTDAHWGVVVFAASVGTLNTEGCVDDALMQVQDEKANQGSGSCGDALYASYGCQQAVCGACMGSELTACFDEAVQTGCKSYDTVVESPTGMCSALLGDAAPPAVASCFPDPTITDAAMQRADWITRMATYMCGP